MKKSVILAVLILGLSGMADSLYAQNDPLLTHYVFNKQSYNPGIVGVKGVLDVGAIYRNQWWSGIEGAPKTLQVFANAEILGNSGVGLNVISDKIGLTSTTGLDLAYAYRIKFDRSNVAFGVMPRFEVASYDWSIATPRDVVDESIGSKPVTSFNVGVGVYYNTDNFYAGLSMPKLLANSLYTDNGFKQRYNTIYFMTGYVFSLSENIKLYPAGLFSHNPNAPMEFELNANVIFSDALMFGASYRHQDAVSGLVQYIFDNGLKAGVAMDFTSSGLNKITTGSYELFVGYTINCDNCDIVNLRYF